MAAPPLAPPPLWMEQPRKPESIYQRLSAMRFDGETVSQVLNEYVREGKPIRKKELETCVTELRKYRRFQHALQIMEWMGKRGINFSHADSAVWIDLMLNTEGIAAAEDYFDNLPLSFKNRRTYGALLNCYCQENMIDKALDLFKKMDDLGYASCNLAFTNLMSLYLRLKQPEKVPPLVEEMKRRKIPFTTRAYNFWMKSCADSDDIEGVNKVMEEIPRDDERKCNWTTYSNLAVIYEKAGIFEKAGLAIEKIEEMKPPVREAYHFLISWYTNLSNLDAVKRVWMSLKMDFPMTNSCYLVMLHALAKLDAADGLKECFEEWESCCKFFDERLPIVAVKAYLKWDMVEEAEQIFEVASKKHSRPILQARKSFIEFFLSVEQVRPALEHMEAAVSEVRDSNWYFSPEIVSGFFQCFEKYKDVEGAEVFCKLLKKAKLLDSNAYRSLLQVYTAAGKAAPEIRFGPETTSLGTETEMNLDRSDFIRYWK